MGALHNANIKFLGVPYWPGRRILNTFVDEFNMSYNSAIKDYGWHNVTYIDVNESLQGQNRVKRAIHLSSFDKYLIMLDVSNVILYGNTFDHHYRLLYRIQ